MTIVRTPLQVRLRPLRGEDSELVRGWRNSPAVAAGMITNHTIGRLEHEAWLADVLAGADCRYWVICANGRPAGLAYLYDIAPVLRRCRWGFYNAEVGLRARGVAKSALASVLDLAFGELGMDAVDAEVLADNGASLAIHRRLGFRVLGSRSAPIRHAGRDVDVVTLALHAHDWQRRREGRGGVVGHDGAGHKSSSRGEDGVA